MLLKGLMFEVDSPVCTNPENEFPMWLSPEHTRDVLPKDVNGIMIRVKTYAPLACGIIVNSTRELEIPVVKALSDIDSMRTKSIFMVGPLIPTAGLSSTKQQQARLVTEWLSSKERNSVLYISFGTIISPSPEQLSEMASAFLAMNRPFIWSLPDTLRLELPDEIRSRMSDSTTDFLVLDWVPQKTILAHFATAAFLSHCGWNSTIEALCCGVPIICWPLCSDQDMNVELVLKHGAGIRVQGTGWKAERTVYAQEIVQLINHVISKELYRTKALEASRMLNKAVGPGGSSAVDFANLIQQLSQKF